MSMSDYWKDFGLGLMNLFDLPGSMVRDIFAWENPLDQIASPFSAKDRATGADVLRNFGVEDPGMLAGMGVEFLLDPLMLAGGLGALKGAKMSAKLGPRYRFCHRPIQGREHFCGRYLREASVLARALKPWPWKHPKAEWFG